MTDRAQLDDDSHYAVQLKGVVRYGELKWLPRHRHSFSGRFLKVLLDRPENAGLIVVGDKVAL